MREVALAVARRALVEALDVLAAGGAERALGRRPQVELSVADDVGAERLAERLRDLLAHLVAARPDGRPDRSGERGAAVQRAHAGGDDAAEQSAPAGMQDPDRRPASPRGNARERDRQAVGGEEQHRPPRRVAPQTVAVLVHRPRRYDDAVLRVA